MPRVLQHFFCVLARRRSNVYAAQHARNFLGARRAVERINLAHYTAFACALGDAQLLVRTRRHLGKMGDTHHLLTARQAAEQAADDFRHAPADASINLVENQRRHAGMS